MTRRMCGALLILCACGATGTRSTAADRVIHITGPGMTAQYILQGETEQRPVHVQVGQTVLWKNDAGTTAAHTASSKQRDANGNRLFDTGSIEVGGEQAVAITREIYSAAGGVAGGSVEIEYICRIHGEPSMKSSLIVEDSTVRTSGLKLRRDIKTLSSAELSAYRDAWRLAQATAEYRKVSGHHGCPDGWCHRDEITFLPWHREYLLRMEAVIGQPIHYWDWTATEAAVTGIPAAFSDATYVSTDGNTYPNPLRSFSFVCGGSQTTGRQPDAPSNLQSLAKSVQSTYTDRIYSRFNSDLDGPHGGLHVWVGGQMGGITFAGYDPLFWAHHSNVDRQWASWQRGGGPDPVGGELNEELFGFNLRVADRLDPASLGYAYDRYDPMPTRRFAPEALAAAGPTPLQASSEAAMGIGKTFDVPAEGLAAAAAVEEGPTYLYVGGIPAHPTKSYAVYVFVNQPNATPEDAKPDNPHYAGYFGVFGSGEGREPEARHEKAAPRRALVLFGGNKSRLREPARKITLVVTTDQRVVVPQKDIPFDSASIGRSAPSVAVTRAADVDTARGEEFTGVSKKESYDEAYQDAVNQAQQRLGAGDQLINVKVLSVEGERGGIAGVRNLFVKIRASVK